MMIERQPFAPTGCPYVVEVLEKPWGKDTIPLVFGPFPTYREAKRFIEINGFTAYRIGAMFPPSDGVYLVRGIR